MILANTIYISLTVQRLPRRRSQRRGFRRSGDEPEALEEHVKGLEEHKEVGEDPEGLNDASNEREDLGNAGEDLEVLKEGTNDLEGLQGLEDVGRDIEGLRDLDEDLEGLEGACRQCEASEKSPRGELLLLLP